MEASESVKPSLSNPSDWTDYSHPLLTEISIFYICLVLLLTNSLLLKTEKEAVFQSMTVLFL